MKKVLVKVFALALAMALLCGAALAEVRTTGNVWMRKGPGLSYDQVTSFSTGKTLTFLQETSEDDRGVIWYKVTDGKNTGWGSSRYTELVGETVEATEAPTVEPTATPVVEPTQQPEATEAPAFALPDAGLLFSNAETTEAPADAAPGETVELSQFYQDELVVAANEIGLISYRQVESEAPYQYYNDSVIVAGNQYVENIVVYGAGYEVFGVSVGMNANAAMACLNAAGLDYVESEKGITYEHKGNERSAFVDENGHDSCINLWVSDDNVITEIDWSTYTG